MPSSVPTVPRGDMLRRLGVGKPVSSAHGALWCDDLAFLLAYNVETVASITLPVQTSGTGTTVNIAYARSPGAMVVRVVIELAVSAVGDSLHATVALGSATLIGGSWLDGTGTLIPPGTSYRTYREYVAFLDVSGVTVGTIQDLSVSWSSITGGKGVYKITVGEVPLYQTDTASSPTTEPGINGAWPNPPNRLVDGTTSTSLGFVRLEDQLDQARSKVRRHAQIATIETTAQSWSTTSTSLAAITWTGIAGGFDPIFYMRARRLYATSDANVYTLRCRYTTNSGAVAGKLRAIVTPIGGVAANTDLTLPAAAGWTSAAVSISIPNSGTGQECSVSFQALRVSAGTLNISQIALVELEP